MTGTLTDRYVHAVTRAVPAAQRTDLGPEIRALVDDAIEARLASGQDTDRQTAERAALAELGDPDLLAGRYADRPQYLLGPAYFGPWQRLLTLLLPIVVPIVSLVVGSTHLLGGGTPLGAVGNALATAIGVGVQLVFWVTLVFVLVERTGAAPSVTGEPWTVDDLPELPDDGRIGIGEMAGTVAANVALLAGLLWVQLATPIEMSGERFVLFDPALWSFWLPFFIAVTIGEILFTIVLYRRGRWTTPFAVANAILGAAFAIPAVWLLQNDLLLNPQLVAQVTRETGGEWLDITGMTIAIVVVLTVAWDAIDGFRKAWRASRPQASVIAALG